jgi:hypothetical protein
MQEGTRNPKRDSGENKRPILQLKAPKISFQCNTNTRLRKKESWMGFELD